MARLFLLSTLLIAFCIAFASSNNENDIVRIINSGSTNTAGYIIELQRDGIVRWTVSPRRPILSSTTAMTSIRLPSAMVNTVFQSVEQASPLSQFAPIFCVKSVSFGTTLHVTFNGQQSPDLSCPLKDNRLVVLNKSVHEVISALHINTLG